MGAWFPGAAPSPGGGEEGPWRTGPRRVPAFSRRPGAASESISERSGDKGQKGPAEPGLGQPRERGDRLVETEAGRGRTSPGALGLLSPTAAAEPPEGRRAGMGGPEGTGGRGAGGAGAGLVTWRGARGWPGRGRALGSLKAREPNREKRLCGRRRRPGLTSETRSSGPNMRRLLCLALAASLLHGKAAGLPPLHSSSARSRAHPGWLGAPRAEIGRAHV